MISLAAALPTPLWVMIGYLGLLIALGLVTKALFRGTSSDYFLAGRSIGPFLLLTSVFGTTMTAFSLIGSTGKAYELGIGVYGLMASSSGLVHSLVFFLVGLRLWAIGKRYDYSTQIQFFRARFESNGLGYLLFPILVALVVVYVLIGIVGAGVLVRSTTQGLFPETFPGVADPRTGALSFVGAVPPWITGLVVSGVVLFYISLGGVRGAAWANALQTVVFLVTGVVAFWSIAHELGGFQAASAAVAANAPEHLARAGKIGHLQFLSYALVPLSVGMFPHLFQHWLTAKSAKTFRLTIVCHPLAILVVWLPCILMGIWALGAGIEAPGGNPNAVLPAMIGRLVASPFLSGLLMAGLFTAITSSLDSQLLCLGTMFTHDVVLHAFGRERFSDARILALGRIFIAGIAAATYALSLVMTPKVFDLGVWCFSGFAGLCPLAFAALYWRRATRAGAIASVLAMLGTWGWFFYGGFLRPTLAGVPVSDDYLVLGMMPIAFVVAAATLALVAVSLLTKPPPREVVERFVPPRRAID